MADISPIVNPWLSFPLDWQEVWNLRTSPVEDGGLPQRALKQAQPTYEGTWRLVYGTQSDADAFRAFWNARKGGLEAFDWTNPEDGHTYNLVFTSATWGFAHEGPEQWVFQVSVAGVRTA